VPQLPSGVITAVEHPPYGVLTREFAFNLTSGVTQVQRIRGPVNVDAFGLSFSFITVPAAFGYTQRIHKDYEIPIVQVAPLYTLFDGHGLYGPIQELTHEGDIVYLDQLFPTRVDVWVQVGCLVAQYWIVAL